MGSIIVITSGKGGTGKTTVAAGLASTLAVLGRRVVAVDCDIGLHNLDLALGMQDRIVFDFEDVLSGRTCIEKALIEHHEIPRLTFLPSPPVQCGMIDPLAFNAMISSLASSYDYCILDSPAGIGHGFRLASGASGKALVVSTPDTPCIMDSGIATGLLLSMGIEDVSLVLNKVSKNCIRKRRAYNIDECIDSIGIPLAGIIYEDENVRTAFNRCEPLLTRKSSKAVKCIIELAKRLEGFPIRPAF